jgi:hypothetical protein
MEPMPEKEAVSPFISFTDTRYFDKSTSTNEMRTLALVRTSDKTGYYVDIFRSDNRISNDYVYHNIGDRVTFLNSQREQINTVPTEYPLSGIDVPGFRYFKEVQKLSGWTDDLIALFSIKDEQANDLYMQVLLPGKTGRNYYQAMTPRTKTSGRVYSRKTLPVFTMHDTAESLTKPFIAVFEPYRDKNGYSVDRISVEQRNDGGDFTALMVFNRDLSKQLILQALDNSKTYSSGKWSLIGYFGIVGLTGENISYLYLGKGSLISYEGYSLSVQNGVGSANLKISGDKYVITCNQETTFGFPVKKVEEITLSEGSRKEVIRFTEKVNSITFILPAVKNGEIRVQLKAN